jgi:hypothetical protein
MGTPFALDFGAVMIVAAARGADSEMVADLLPVVETAVLASLSDDESGGMTGDEG